MSLSAFDFKLFDIEVRLCFLWYSFPGGLVQHLPIYALTIAYRWILLDDTLHYTSLFFEKNLHSMICVSFASFCTCTSSIYLEDLCFYSGLPLRLYNFINLLIF